VKKVELRHMFKGTVVITFFITEKSNRL